MLSVCFSHNASSRWPQGESRMEVIGIAETRIEAGKGVGGGLVAEDEEAGRETFGTKQE